MVTSSEALVQPGGGSGLFLVRGSKNIPISLDVHFST